MTQTELYEKLHEYKSYRRNNQGLDCIDLWIDRIPIINVGQNLINTVLEAGCGNGILCSELAVRGYEVTGIDIADGHYIRHGYNFKIHDMTSGSRFGGYDYVLSFDVLEHLSEEVVGRVIEDLCESTKRTVVFSAACYGGPPIHMTVKSPGWWLDKAWTACPEMKWSVLSIYNRRPDCPVVLICGEK